MKSKTPKAKKLLMALLMATSLLGTTTTNGKTRVTPSSYIVSDIEATSSLSERSQAEKELFKEVKEKAFSFVKLYLNKADLQTNDIDIDSLMIEFTPVQIKRQGEGFVGLFEVVFDRAAIESVLTVSRVNKVKKEGLRFRVALKKGPIEWLIVKETLFKTKVDYRITLMWANFVEGQADTTPEELERIMINRGFEVIKNNAVYFIKPVSVNDR